MDVDKVAAVASWPAPCFARGLRGFPGLAGYYRKFIRDFGMIAAPLTRLLWRDAFSWDDAGAVFQALKGALTTGPVLQMPDFDMPFTVDCDASGVGFGAVLHQGTGPLAFFCRPFAARHLKLAAYEWELIDLVQAVRHWHPYLWGRTFVLRTDHYNLKYLLDQRVSTVPQHQWISKLFGFDFTVEYRLGRLNTVVDALSRRDAELLLLPEGAACRREAAACALSNPSYALIDDIRTTTKENPDAQLLTRRLQDVRDPVFTGHVWRDLFKMAAVTLRMSTAFHPQTNGQTEVVNKVIAMYLRCVTSDGPRAGLDWLPWAEYCYNTLYHSALRATPFEVVCGR
ncbi:hypothetical protein U9M48_000841 [Paspalum notatum var. saurae]|uniref:Integrase catalytic domain-containing protein n=1 Tax=Paspalum notatum var. saurae TaxID=547442 RepID=A0AAQ3PKV8_PASNO